ncbi:MAG: cyclic pyranopterin monophosphate synthase MoaC [Planctomycetota bacterium]|jgi:cyclic pyranopterin phosphate synthase
MSAADGDLTGIPSPTHLDAEGKAHMVDVGAKDVTARTAVAEAVVRMQPATRTAVLGGELPKGDAIAVARIAGIQAAKRTPEWIPLCHHIALSSVEIDIAPRGDDQLVVTATARATDKTGVEMEALVAASTAALTLYDMSKAVEKGIVIEQVRLLKKTGGKSGDWSAS